MKIRSITCFLNPSWPLDESRLQKTGALIAAAKKSFASAGYEVQTARLATPPFAKLLPTVSTDSLIQLAAALEGAALAIGVEYVSLGPALIGDTPAFMAIPPALGATQNVFFSGQMAEPEKGISLDAVHLCAEVIHHSSTISPDGFANLRFAALSNVPPDAPFFPAAYASSDKPAFALALEAADLAVDAIGEASSLAEARDRLISIVELHAAQLMEICSVLKRDHHFDFKGLDFTLAPFPDEKCSVGAALERLGVPAVGLHGSLAGTAFLTDALGRARYLRTGFNSVFMPVLEDSILASRAASGDLNVKDLLLMSAVCGTGLDTVPLPGDISVDQIYALLLDLAFMGLRLNKPLTARLMPIPGKQAGDPTGFNFAFFANSRVMSLQARPLDRLLAGTETVPINPRL